VQSALTGVWCEKYRMPRSTVGMDFEQDCFTQKAVYGRLPPSSASVRRRAREATPPPPGTYTSMSGALLDLPALDASPDAVSEKVSRCTEAPSHHRASDSSQLPRTPQEPRSLMRRTFDDKTLLVRISACLLILIGVGASLWALGSQATGESTLVGDKLQSFIPMRAQALEPKVQRAMRCSGLRNALVDILAGARYEFDIDEGVATEELLHKLSLTFQTPDPHDAPMVENDESEVELAKVILNISATGGGWPEAIALRLRAVLGASCEDDAACSGSATNINVGKPLVLEVDEEATSEGAVSAGSSWIHQAALKAAATLTQMPSFAARAEQHRSRPASTVTSEHAAARGDCFAMRGDRTSMAFRLKSENGTSSRIRYIVIEQPSRLVAIPSSTPRRFQIFGDPATEVTADSVNPYSMRMGSFEYALGAPAAQIFETDSPNVLLQGLRLVFEGAGWGAPVVCVNRIRAYDSLPPICSGGHLVVPIPK